VIVEFQWLSKPFISVGDAICILLCGQLATGVSSSVYPYRLFFTLFVHLVDCHVCHFANSYITVVLLIIKTLNRSVAPRSDPFNLCLIEKSALVSNQEQVMMLRVWYLVKLQFDT
jgi:hypothetical protein